MKAAFIFLALMHCGLGALSATLTVERDGSGDFFVIQDAVDAAASGDTIMIGPGRFDEGQVVSVPGWTEYVRVLVKQEHLTIIGAGVDQTIIGPNSPWDLSQGFNMGVEGGPGWGNDTVIVKGVSFENMGYAVHSFPASNLFIEDCRFSGNHYSIFAINGVSVDVVGCEFRFMPRDGKFLFLDNNPVVAVTGSTFTLADESHWIQLAVQFQGSYGEISDCIFIDGTVGLALSVGSSFKVNRCSFVGQERWGMLVNGGASLEMVDSRFEDQDTAFFLSNIGKSTITRTEIASVSRDVVRFDSSGGDFSITDSILAHGPQYTIYQFSPCDKDSVEYPHIDMTNNDWGTTIADSIESWISTCTFVVDYEPFVGQETPVEDSSLGSFKSMFR